MTALFIADLHLSPDRPGTTRAFLDFLERRASRAEALYILGDLFEAWIGDDDPSELARTVIDALQRLSRGGTALFFLHGNRDFLVGRRFGRKTGAQLLPEVHVANLYGQPVLLLHGDSDTFIVPTQARMLLDASTGDDVTLQWLEGADHSEVPAADPEAYAEALQGFIDQHLP